MKKIIAIVAAGIATIAAAQVGGGSCHTTCNEAFGTKTCTTTCYGADGRVVTCVERCNTSFGTQSCTTNCY